MSISPLCYKVYRKQHYKTSTEVDDQDVSFPKQHKQTSLSLSSSDIVKKRLLKISRVTSCSLLSLHSFEERLEVTGTKSVKVVSLNDLKKDCRSIQHRLGENLKQITAFIEVDQDVISLDRCKVFFEIHVAFLKLQSHSIVVVAGYLDELGPTLS